jgi:hypothetical protein
MITSFEVGAVFRIINEASPALTKILAQVRELNATIAKAKENLAVIGKMPGMTAAIRETDALAKSWGTVAKSAESARVAIGAASRIPATGGGGGGRARLGSRLGIGGGRSHIGGGGVSIPGGGHVNFRGGAAAAAGLVGYGAYEAAQMEDAVFQVMYHSGVTYNDANRTRIRKILQESMRTSGYGIHDLAEAATQEIRMFADTGGGGPDAGLEVLPEMLRSATTESRLKGGTTPKESMSALVGLAHMTKEYGPDAVKKLAKDFAFLSIHNPSSLQSMERAAGYAVPILQSGMNIDPMDTLLLGTALTRAGITNTKSGTWLREMAVRAMPGTAIFESEKKAEHHDELLKKIGLLDENGKPTWFTNGRPDILKMMEIGQAGLDKLTPTERMGAERKIFGAQGSGGMAVLSDKNVSEQVTAMRKRRDSAEWANRYGGFSEAYSANSTVQQARTAMADFNIAMMDIGQHVLPAVSGALKDFKRGLEFVTGLIPGAKKDGGSIVGSRALEGAAAGALAGLAFGGVGAVPGAMAGGVLGTAEGVMEQYARQSDQSKSEAMSDVAKSLAGGEAGGQQKANLPPISFSLNIDGKALARAVSQQQDSLYRFETNPTDFNGSGRPP